MEYSEGKGQSKWKINYQDVNFVPITKVPATKQKIVAPWQKKVEKLKNREEL